MTRPQTQRFAERDGGTGIITSGAQRMAPGPVEEFVRAQRELYRAEYASTDPELQLTCAPATAESVLEEEFQLRLLRALYAVPCGVYRLSPEVEGLVQTSNNLARVQVGDGEFSVACLTRGAVDSEKLDLARAVGCALELAGAEVSFLGAYPGWTPRPEAGIVRLMLERMSIAG